LAFFKWYIPVTFVIIIIRYCSQEAALSVSGSDVTLSLSLCVCMSVSLVLTLPLSPDHQSSMHSLITQALHLSYMHSLISQAIHLLYMHSLTTQALHLSCMHSLTTQALHLSYMHSPLKHSLRFHLKRKVVYFHTAEALGTDSLATITPATANLVSACVTD
jgi:hypothetical protein